MTREETKTCQNCSASFVIDVSDFDFYQKISVPPPTFCPECRLLRRLAWRNERTLFKASCDLCKREMFSLYRPGSPFPVYCRECWFSDRWDSLSYGTAYDFDTPFFVQFHELMRRVPRLHLWQRNAVNSPYASNLGEVKNVYLSYSVVSCEDIFYSKHVDRSREIFDSMNVMDSEHCFWNVFGTQNYGVRYSLFTRSCLDAAFLFDCVNCRHCFMSSNLRNREYVFRNRQYSKEEYEAALEKARTGSYEQFQSLTSEFNKMHEGALHRYANIIKSVRATGDVLSNAKSVRFCFDAYDVEDCAYVFRAFGLNDCMDICHTIKSELVYEYISGGRNNSNIRFTKELFEGIDNADYVDHGGPGKNFFGCIGVRNSEYCILNTKYGKEEYAPLRARIIEHMNTMPYVDKKGKVYTYGEFFPAELSPFAYNETIAQEYFPLTKEQAIAQGYRWREPETKSHAVTKKPEDLPDHIKDADDSMLHETIGCAHGGTCNEQCTTAFKIIPQELQFYRTMNLPLPRLCPNCRHYARLAQRNPMKLWHRKCTCAGQKSENDIYANTATHVHGAGLCPNEFETAYAPERPEVVYCEQCYNAEVA